MGEVALKKEREERVVEQEERLRCRERMREVEAEKAGRVVERIDLHIPLRENVVVDVPTMTRTMDETMVCYHDPEGGVTCLHAHMEVEGQLLDMSFRRKTKFRKARG